MTFDLRFYYGAASGWNRKALRVMKESNIIINYATQNNKPWDGIDNLMIDSGGYSFMKKQGKYDTPDSALQEKGDYLTTDKDYIDYIQKYNPDLFALRDYPCEPDLLEDFDRTVQDNQQLTSQRHHNLLNLIENRGIKATPVSVLQGWKKSEYLEHLDKLRENGLIKKHLAIGSVCRRGQEKQIRDIILAVRENVSSQIVLHGFGVKISVLKYPEVVKALDMADSMAFAFKASHEMTQEVGFEDMPLWKVCAYEYLKFKARINQLINNGNDGQRKINSFKELPTASSGSCED